MFELTQAAKQELVTNCDRLVYEVITCKGLADPHSKQ